MVTLKTASDAQLLTVYQKLEAMSEISERDEQLLDMVSEELFCRGLGV